MKQNMGYSMRCNQQTELSNQNTCFPSLYLQYIAFSPFNYTCYTFFSKTWAHRAVYACLYYHQFGAWLCRRLAGRALKANREQDQTIHTFTANVQKVSTHKCRKEMYARSKCQMNFFFKQSKEAQYIRTYEASLACSFPLATCSAQTLFHPSQALILLTQAISSSQPKFRAIFFFFTPSTRLKKKKCSDWKLHPRALQAM